MNRPTITEKYEDAVSQTIEYIKNHKDDKYLISFSGGKDSLVVYKVWLDAISRIDFDVDWIVQVANTSNDTAQTYQYIKHIIPKDKLEINNPQAGYYMWLKNVKKYFLPNKRVRNCCSTYKEGAIKKIYYNGGNISSITGLRKWESQKRAEYQFVMDYEWRKSHFDSSSFPKNWVNLAPIIDFTDEEIWLLILDKKWEYNKMYDYGFARVGCLVCPYQTSYNDMLIKYYYPKSWERWKGILSKSYEVMEIATRLKWTLDEWINGAWKEATSKENYIITKSPTQNNIKELAELKGISENMAQKYFRRVCDCGKKLNPTEIAMYYKVYGRQEDNDNDDRTPMCLNCMCKEMGWNKKEYYEHSNEYRDGGCKLF